MTDNKEQVMLLAILEVQEARIFKDIILARVIYRRSIF